MKYYVVDAFADKPFQGNPAAVCVLDKWLDDELLLNIAAENNLSETAYVVRESDKGADYHLRWFTPAREVDLCGHATLATSYVLNNFVEPIKSSVKFRTQSGILEIRVKDGLYEMDFPSRMPKQIPVTDQLAEALGVTPREAHIARDLVVLVDSDEQIRKLNPNLFLLNAVPDYLVCAVTAPGDDCDFVSRTFAPKVNVPEDPVCGSAHCSLIPYWAKRLGKTEMLARQRGRRGGTIYCKDEGERVRIAGRAALYAEGILHI